jgi:hypothetical protein
VRRPEHASKRQVRDPIHWFIGNNRIVAVAYGPAGVAWVGGGLTEDSVMRTIVLAALGAIMLLVNFADDAFAQRRGGGGAGFRGGGGVGFRGGAVGFRGPAFRGGGVGIRRAAVVGGWRGAGVRYAGWRGAGVRYAGWRGAGVRYAGWRGAGWRYPGWRYRRAVIGAGLVGAGIGLYGGYPYGYGYSGYDCAVPRVVWNGWTWQTVLVQACYY